MPASIFSETELARLASFPEEIPDEIQSYARREQKRRQHFTEVREHLGFSMLRSRVSLVAYCKPPSAKRRDIGT